MATNRSVYNGGYAHPLQYVADMAESNVPFPQFAPYDVYGSPYSYANPPLNLGDIVAGARRRYEAYKNFYSDPALFGGERDPFPPQSLPVGIDYNPHLLQQGVAVPQTALDTNTSVENYAPYINPDVTFNDYYRLPLPPTATGMPYRRPVPPLSYYLNPNNTRYNNMFSRPQWDETLHIPAEAPLGDYELAYDPLG